MTPDQILEPEWIFPFEGMSVGDSFFIPTLRGPDMIYAVEMGAKRAKVRIKVYQTTKDNHLGVRVWRIG
jgi:hypothetical protein